MAHDAEKMIAITVNGKACEVADNSTVLGACKALGVSIPTLCHMDGVSESASCSLCMVEIKNAKSLMRACVTRVTPNMELFTNTERVRNARRTNLELLLANHPKDCLECERNGNCELQALAVSMGVRDISFPRIRRKDIPIDRSSPSIVRDPNKCILCGRCVSVCQDVQSVSAVDVMNRGMSSKVTTYMDSGMGDSLCINCGQCSLVCPTAAISQNDQVDDVWKALSDPTKIVVVETAPAVRVAIQECFDMPAGAPHTGKLVASLRRLGFSKVFDTDFTADLTIMEEGFELIHRITHKGVLPLITSCSPGWIKFAESFYPNVLAHVSSCKSPQQMFGAVTKSYYAEKMNIDPRNLVVVSIMPCTAKKFEALRPEMNSAFHFWKEKLNLTEKDSFQDVDFVLTTRELGRMIKIAGIDFANLPDEDYDNPLGESTGAAVIFGTTGGVMEAALRTAYEVLTKTKLGNVDFMSVRGFEGIKEAEVDINGLKLKVAVAHTLKNARVLLEQIQAGTSPYHFIEIMTCPGGCIGGGGQPIPTNAEVRQRRMAAIYEEDDSKQIRKSHENPHVKKLYDEFLKEPLGEKSEELLHTHYAARHLKSGK